MEEKIILLTQLSQRHTNYNLKNKNMKNIKSNYNKLKATITAFCFLIAANNTNAQTCVLPGATDNAWYSSSNAIQGLNTAAIDYWNVYLNATEDIFASVYYDGTSNPTIYAIDPSWVGGNSLMMSSANMQGIPDIAIGNYDGSGGCSTCTSTSTDYIMAVAFIDNTPQIVINFYDLYDDGSSSMSITYLTQTTISATSPQTVHIDVIADYSNYFLTGLPFCSQFVVTWDDLGGGGHKVYAALGDVNLASVGSSKLITPMSAPQGYMPDVAAIGASLTNDPTALITYIDASNNELYLANYDFSTGNLATSTLDAGTSNSTTITKPRIDAIDDYTNNGSSSIAVYKVAAEVDSNNAMSTHVVRTYDNLQYGWPSSSVIDITGVLPYMSYPTYVYNNYAPTVALGPQEYSIAHFMEYASNSDIYFMEPPNIAYPTSFMGGDYYWVNSHYSSGPPTIYPLSVNAYTDYASAVCSPANNPGGGAQLYTWAKRFSGTFYVDYKYSTGPGYAFRHSPTAVGTIEKNSWAVHPNPATDLLTIECGKMNNLTGYSVLDMTGRELMNGTLNCNKTDIDVSFLAAGTYVIKVTGEGNVTSEKLLVKQ